MKPDSQLLLTQMLIDRVQQSFPDAYVAYGKNVNKTLWIDANEEWGIELAKDGWLIPLRADPYTPLYSNASKNIDEVVRVLTLFMEDET